jgi:hypothetical protein
MLYIVAAAVRVLSPSHLLAMLTNEANNDVNARDLQLDTVAGNLLAATNQ